MLEWDEVKKALIAQFKLVNLNKIARDRLASLRQTKLVQSYTYAFQSTILEIEDISELEKLDQFVRGLKERVRQEVEIRNPETIEEAMQIAERFDSITFQMRTLTFRVEKSTYNPNGTIPMEIDSIQ